MKKLRWLLVTLEVIVGLSAVAGGIGLIVTNGLGMYEEAVQPLLYSYTIPGFILTVVVGGSNLFGGSHDAAAQPLRRRVLCDCWVWSCDLAFFRTLYHAPRALTSDCLLFC